jgi:acyl-CoA synthetase (AMP-forming)/AMP-acid ligase II
MVDWFGTSETFMGIHRRLLPNKGGLESAHWRADNDTELLLVDPTDYTVRVDKLNTEGEIVFIRPHHVTMCMGYLDNPELTAEKFIPNPHGEGVMYRTGDLGMWIAPDESKQQPGHCRCRFCVARDGDPGTRGVFDSPEEGTGDRVGVLTVVGRMDFQVKVRAQMVNLEHVDAAATQIAGVQDAGTLAYTDASGDTALALYVQKFDQEASFGKLRAQIREGMLVARRQASSSAVDCQASLCKNTAPPRITQPLRSRSVSWASSAGRSVRRLNLRTHGWSLVETRSVEWRLLGKSRLSSRWTCRPPCCSKIR